MQIAINGQHYCEYPHKVSIRKVSHLLIDGDVKLSVVALEGNAPSHSAENANQSFETPSAPLSQYGPPSGGQYGPPAGAQYGPPQGGYGQPPPPVSLPTIERNQFAKIWHIMPVIDLPT